MSVMYNLIMDRKYDILSLILVTIPKTVPRTQETYIFLRKMIFTTTLL